MIRVAFLTLLKTREVSFCEKTKGTFLIMKWKTRLLPFFSLDSVIRRAVASWFGMALIILFVQSGDFSDTVFLKDKTWDLPICLFFGFFLLFSVIAVCLRTKRTDGFAMVLLLVLVSSVWLSRLLMTDEEKFLFCCVLVGVFALVLWDFISQNRDLMDALPLPSGVALGTVIVCGVVCAIVIGVTTCLRYMMFGSPTYDFGIFVQMFHNMAESFEPLTTCERNEVLSHFAVHLSPIYYILLPFYMLFPSPLTLQIGQAVAVASGIIPFYLLMRKYELSSKARALFSMLYLLYPVISKGCFFDLHENAFLLPLLLWIFWAYESEKIPLLALFTVLCCLIKEDSAVYVAIFALYAMLSGKDVKKKLMGFGMMAYALLYFLFAVWFIDTFGLGIMSGRFENVSSDGSLVGVIFTAFANPGFFFQEVTALGWESVQYILSLLLPLAFLPLATGKPARWILLMPMLLNLLSDYPYQLGLIYQYHFGISAFLLLLTVMNWKDIHGMARRYLLPLALAASFVFYSYLILPELGSRIKTWKVDGKNYIVMEKTMDVIPEDASVNASTFLLPHLAQRYYAYDIGYHAEMDTDFVILDIRGGYRADTKEKAKHCTDNGYDRLIETTQVAIFVSPDWTGDQNAIINGVKAVATVVYEKQKTMAETEEMLQKILSKMPEQASVNVSETLFSFIPSRERTHFGAHAEVNTDFVVFDLRFGHSEVSEALLAECQAKGYNEFLHIKELAIYIAPDWRGDLLALQAVLTEMGYLP